MLDKKLIENYKDKIVWNRSKTTYYKDLITFVADRAGHDARYAIDAKKIQKELKWTPIETFESGIRKTVSWYINNQEWCLDVQDGSYKGVISP